MVDLSTTTLLNLAFYPVIRWEEVEFLLNDSLATARLRIIANSGQEIPQNTYVKPNVAWRPRGIDVGLNHLVVQSHWNQGATLMLAYAAHATASISSFCELIEKSFLGVHCDAHIFVSSCAGNSSFPKHSDESHNFIVPVEGRILVMVYGTDNNSGRLLLCETLSPGQALFIPKGHWHQIQPIERRISLSFPFVILSELEHQDYQRVNL